MGPAISSRDTTRVPDLGYTLEVHSSRTSIGVVQKVDPVVGTTNRFSLERLVSLRRWSTEQTVGVIKGVFILWT